MSKCRLRRGEGEGKNKTMDYFSLDEEELIDRRNKNIRKDDQINGRGISRTEE